MRIVVQLAAGTQPRVGADMTIGTDGAAVDMAIGGNLCALGDAGVADDGVSTDAHVVCELNLAFKDTAHINLHIAPAAQCATHIDACWVGQSHALSEQTLCFDQLPRAFQYRQLRLAVDAIDFPSMVRLHGVYRHALSHGHRDDVSEVVLGL